VSDAARPGRRDVTRPNADVPLWTIVTNVDARTTSGGRTTARSFSNRFCRRRKSRVLPLERLRTNRVSRTTRRFGHQSFSIVYYSIRIRRRSPVRRVDRKRTPYELDGRSRFSDFSGAPVIRLFSSFFHTPVTARPFVDRITCPRFVHAPRAFSVHFCATHLAHSRAISFIEFPTTDE